MTRFTNKCMSLWIENQEAHTDVKLEWATFALDQVLQMILLVWMYEFNMCQDLQILQN